jgi:hypothetical protein
VPFEAEVLHETQRTSALTREVKARAEYWRAQHAQNAYECPIFTPHDKVHSTYPAQDKELARSAVHGRELFLDEKIVLRAIRGPSNGQTSNGPSAYDTIAEFRQRPK